MGIPKSEVVGICGGLGDDGRKCYHPGFSYERFPFAVRITGVSCPEKSNNACWHKESPTRIRYSPQGPLGANLFEKTVKGTEVGNKSRNQRPRTVFKPGSIARSSGPVLIEQPRATHGHGNYTTTRDHIGVPLEVSERSDGVHVAKRKAFPVRFILHGEACAIISQ